VGLNRLPFRILALPFAVLIISFAIGLGGQASGLLDRAAPVLAAGLGIIGLLLIAAALYSLHFARQLQRHFIPTDAVITGHRTAFASFHYRPSVRFSHQGQHTDAVLCTTRQLLPKKGAPIRILFHPRNPRTAYEAAALQLYSVPVGLMVLGGVLVFVAKVQLLG